MRTHVRDAFASKSAAKLRIFFDICKYFCKISARRENLLIIAMPTHEEADTSLHVVDRLRIFARTTTIYL